MLCHDRIATGSKASEERATEDREEVAKVHGHNSQHAEIRVSDGVGLRR